MWNFIMERIPSAFSFFYTILAFFIPFLIYKINQKLHKDLDPPWKEAEEKQPPS